MGRGSSVPLHILGSSSAWQGLQGAAHRAAARPVFLACFFVVVVVVVVVFVFVFFSQLNN